MLIVLQSVVGLAAMIGLAWLMSERRGPLPWALIGIGLGLQVAIATLLLMVPVARDVLLVLNGLVEAIDAATQAGASFVFGYLAGGPAPFEISDPSRSFIIAFRVLPQVMLLSVLVALFWHWRILPIVVGAFAALLKRTMGVRGATGLAAAGSLFLGMVEAPLIIRPYLRDLSRSELFLLMTCGMATVAGSVMVIYAAILGDYFPSALGHVVIASVMSIPAAVLFARIMVPGPLGTEDTADTSSLSYQGSMDAISRGTQDGVMLAVNVGAMLVVLMALIALVNGALGLFPDIMGSPLTLERTLGWVFAPLAFLMGIPAEEVTQAGALLGTKTVLNELVAYVQFAALPGDTFNERTKLILTYAMCGFANLGSLGILIGGIGTMCPERRGEVIDMGARAIASGTLASCMTGSIVGLLFALFPLTQS